MTASENEKQSRFCKTVGYFFTVGKVSSVASIPIFVDPVA